MPRRHIGAVLTIFLIGGLDLEATPQFARRYQLDCSYCHVAPPRLNERGLAFLANGYRFEGIRPMPAHSTVPAAVWNTFDVESRHTEGFTKGFPGRVEVLLSGPIGGRGAAYFIEWRALSLSVGGNGQLVNRSGRFEDLFVRVPLSRDSALSVTAGQFRALNQIDLSQRLSLSEPLAFSSSLPSATAASSSRLTSLRAFSPAGRQPAVRLEYQQRTERSPADGWFAGVTLPLTGELTIPFTDAASFELEGRPKGVFVEAFRRSGTNTVGAHGFAGDHRRLASVAVTRDLTPRFMIMAAVGRFWAPTSADTRFSIGGEYTLSRALAGGIRYDDRTAPNTSAAVLLYGNVHMPFGPAAFRQALRLQIEQRVQRGGHMTALALSHVF